VELGAYAVVPVQAERSVVRYDAKKAAKRVERWNAIAESAAKQSKRGIIPNVTEPISYKEALNKAKEMDMILIRI
jgi:16S rRNA (uracil1498-N3)-methyltransferase